PIARMQFDARGISPDLVGTASNPERFSPFDTLTGGWTDVAIGAGVGLSLLFAAGIFPRITGLLAVAFEVFFLRRSDAWQDGSDCLVRCLVVFLCLARLDGRGDTGIAALRLVRLQIAVVYLATACWKLSGRDWRDGTALYWVLQDPKYQRISLDFLLST